MKSFQLTCSLVCLVAANDVDGRRALLPAVGSVAELGGGQPARAGRRRSRSGGALPARERGLEPRHGRSRRRKGPGRRPGLRRQPHLPSAPPADVVVVVVVVVVDLTAIRRLGRSGDAQDADGFGASVAAVEVEGGVSDPPEGAGHRRSGLAGAAVARRSAGRLFGDLGGGRRRIEGSPVHRRHGRDALAVARHRLPHPSRTRHRPGGGRPVPFAAVDHRHAQSAAGDVRRGASAAGGAAHRPTAVGVADDGVAGRRRSPSRSHRRRRRRRRHLPLPAGPGRRRRRPTPPTPGVAHPPLRSGRPQVPAVPAPAALHRPAVAAVFQRPRQPAAAAAATTALNNTNESAHKSVKRSLK